MANPILNDNFGAGATVYEGDVMSINGTIQKTLLMLIMLIISASYTWGLTLQGFTDKAQVLGIAGSIAALISIVIMYFAKKTSWLWATIYSVGEGFFIGLISLMFEKAYPGIVIQAVGGTFAAMFSMLLLYRAGLIRCTEKFRAVMMTAIASVFLIYLIQFVASYFGRGIPQIFTASPVGIVFSCIVVVIAALGFIMDFNFIEQGANRLAPKYWEWMGAVGLMTSIVWLYIELLQLLAKLNDRN